MRLFQTANLISILFLPKNIFATISSIQNNLILKKYAPNVLYDFLSVGSDGQSDQDIFNLYTHGCWCARLTLTPYSEYLGGSDPYDELDHICKDWIQTRYCNDVLPGGSCFSSDADLLAASSYTLSFELDNISDATCESDTTSSTCGFDTCKIDNFYLQRIRNFLNDDNLPYSHLQVQSAGTCVNIIQNLDQNRICLGEVPDLFVTEAVDCYCLNGVVDSITTAGKCPVQSAELCESCNDNYRLDSNGLSCELAIIDCVCENGEANLLDNGSCTENLPTSCSVCDADYQLDSSTIGISSTGDSCSEIPELSILTPTVSEESLSEETYPTICVEAEPYDAAKYQCLNRNTDINYCNNVLNNQQACNIFRSCMTGGTNKCPDTCNQMLKTFPREMCKFHNKSSNQCIFWRNDEVNMEVCYKAGSAAEICWAVESFLDQDELDGVCL